MLAEQYPTFPHEAPADQSAFQFVHRYEPTESVSGDFFSISAISDTEVGVFICDVTGHGVRAALVTAMIRALAEDLKPLARDPGNFLRKLNGDLCSILKNTGSPMLTTGFYAVADSRTGRLRFANAGQPGRPRRLPAASNGRRETAPRLPGRLQVLPASSGNRLASSPFRYGAGPSRQGMPRSLPALVRSLPAASHSLPAMLLSLLAGSRSRQGTPVCLPGLLRSLPASSRSLPGMLHVRQASFHSRSGMLQVRAGTLHVRAGMLH